MPTAADIPRVDDGDRVTPEDSVRKSGARADLYQSAQVGRCVNSVTHDINNMLGAIMSYAELISLDGESSEETQRMANEIVGVVNRSALLISTMTAIGRKKAAGPTLCDPAEIVRRVVDLWAYEMRIARVSVTVTERGGLRSLLVNEAELVRAVLELLMLGKDRTADALARRIAITVTGSPGGVTIAFRDSGPAMSEEESESAFDPEYGTAANPDSGLGLYLARENVRAHHGDLAYDPAQGFLIELPRHIAGQEDDGGARQDRDS